MAEPLKNLFSTEFYQQFIEKINTITPVSSKDFFHELYTESWNNLSLKERLQHTATVINYILQGTYETKVSILVSYINTYEHTAHSDWMLGYMFIPQFVEMYGLDSYDTSIHAIERITQFTSCEFAIRPFIIQEPEKTMQQMLQWASHSHSHVRRLSSEGCRPRLPWAMQLPDFIKDPSPIIPILETLHNDSSLFVRKSVANNINDISKDNPAIALELCNSWKHTNENTNSIIEHGLRTLLKQGNQKALEICELQTQYKLQAENFTVHSTQVYVPNALEFSFEFSHGAPVTTRICIEYCLYFLRSNGTYHKKVFRIKQAEFAPHTAYTIRKKHSFVPISTRTYYSGTHYISIQIHGTEFQKIAFELLV